MMKKLFVVFVGCLLYGNAFPLPVKVTRIVDGDTFMADVLLENDIKVRSVAVRVRNVDTPELHGACESEIKHAEQAKQRLSELIPEGTVIEIDNMTNDKYQGRIDANVYDSLNRDVGKILVREKMGRPYSGKKRESWCK